MNDILTDRRTLTMFVSIALSGLLTAAGCSSSGADAGAGVDAGDTGGSGSGGGAGTCPPLAAPAVPVVTTVIHTGYDGVDEFIGPILGNFTPDSVTTDNSSVDTVELFGDCNLVPPPLNPITAFQSHVVAVVHPKSAGNSKVTVKLGAKEFAVNVVVENYSPATIALGKKRYYEPDNPSATRKPCAMCHAQADGPDHSPGAVAFVDDGVLRTISSMGTLPACIGQFTGSECTCGQPNCTTIPPDLRVFKVPGGHSWDFTPAELNAIAPYLRSLPLKQR